MNEKGRPINGAGGFGGSRKGGGPKNGGHHANSPLDSEVYLIFGEPGTGQNTIGYGSGAGVCNNGGMGTVVDNSSTILTADHVAAGCAATQTTLWVQVNGNWVTYSLADVSITTGPGDLATLSLPSELQGSVTPASMTTDHHIVPGEVVDVMYYERIINEDGLLTGFALLTSTTTVKQNWRVRTDYGPQVMLSTTLPPGSSGGGVFSDGHLIGVNSYADNVNFTGTTMASLCRALFGSVC